MVWAGVSVLGLATIVVAVLMVPVGVLSWLNGDTAMAAAFLQSACLLTIAGAGLSLARFGRPQGRAARNEILTVIGCFSVLPLGAALPLYTLPNVSLGEAFFEMVSTFTTTGFRSYAEGAALPPAAHAWRAITAWLGGFVTLVAAAAVFGPRNLGGYEVQIEQRTGSVGRLTGMPRWARTGERSAADRRLASAVASIAPAYLLITVVLWLLFTVSGVDPMTALMQTAGIVSTSGLGLDGGAFRGGIALEALALGFTVLAASRHVFAPGGLLTKVSRLPGDPEIELAGFTVAVAVGWVMLRGVVVPEASAMADTASGWLAAGWGAFFTTASFLSTTGYESAQWQVSHGAAGLGTPGMLLLALAIMGGGVASTAGGVKLLRSFALFRHGMGEMHQLSHPSAISSRGQGRRRVGFAGAQLAWLFLMLFLLALGLCAVALSLTGLPLDVALSASVAASTNTGPVYAVAAGPGAPAVADMAPGARLILAIAMIVGRVEVLAVVALANPAYWQRH